MQIDSYIAVTKAKGKLLDMIRDINDRDDTIAITKDGIPTAVIMSMEQYEAMRETMTIMADEDTMKQMRASIKDMQGKKALVDLEDIL
ncbi:MAG: type II toxin-antitoxin system prevent-host-death family antitoxin [Paludibacter sp.]|nr:type II toxin-antitoxin system prevent-host-death family antitoxin [Paludibacter sp.]MDD4073799.1 type II toxin-antitoxin system prevent-host-death family antitoxin [Desulfobacterales bacterium]MDD4428551.1 type II toxin-antitoxin system prevent-host-death family antitoxin [Paludibacter sp.]